MRTVDGMKVAFVESDLYFQGFHTPSMGSIAKETGADVVFLLAPGATEDSLSDDKIREFFASCEGLQCVI